MIPPSFPKRPAQVADDLGGAARGTLRKWSGLLPRRSTAGFFCRIATALVLLLPAAVFAGLPQPMCVFYGQALDGYGWPYTTNAQVVLVHENTEIARHAIRGSISPGVNFALYVHLDSGTTPTDYSPRALRSGDEISIVVRDAQGERPIVEFLEVPPVGNPGELIEINVTAGEDLDGDGLPDQWEQELVNWSFGGLGSILDVHPWEGFDGGGQSNWDEYGAGTFAFLEYDFFFAEEFGRTTNGRFGITFLSVPGKLYGARYVHSLNQPLWTPSPVAATESAPFQATPLEGTGDWLTLYLPGTLSSALYRPTVESPGSYKLTSTSILSSAFAQDNAGNDPYPVSQFQIGDNGGWNFEPWMKLESDTFIGTRYLGASIGDSLYSWGLGGTYGVGRALPGTAHKGLWQIRMVHDPDNTGFSGFNLKTAGLAGFDVSELIRVGLAPDEVGFDGTGVYVSTDGGDQYTFLDCGWVDGRGDVILYQLFYDEAGGYTLTVNNLDEEVTSQFSGQLPSSAVLMLGVAVFGATLDESVAFDSLAFQSGPILEIEHQGEDVVLSWLTGFAGYTLQSNTDLSQVDGWTPVAEPVVAADGVSRVVLPAADAVRFFRLAK